MAVSPPAPVMSREEQAAQSRARTVAYWAILGALAVLPVLLRLPFLTEPFDTDEGGYAYIAQVWLEGQIPYRDAWDNKPPLTFLVYAGALATGGGIAAIRLAAAGSIALSTVLLVGLGQEAFGRRTGLMTGAAFVFATALPLSQGTNANTEIFLLPGWIGAAWAFLVGLRGGSRWAWPVSGALLALALLAKPVAGWLAVAMFATLVLLVARHRLSLAGAIGLLAGLALGGLLVLVPAGLYFAAHGALDDALQATVWFNRLYLARNFAFAWESYGPWATLFVPNRQVVQENALIWLFGLAGILSLPLAGRILVRTGFLLLWTLAGWLGAKTGWLELAHYYLQVLPALALWAAFYATRIVPLLARRSSWAAPLIGVPALVLLAWSLAQSVPIYLAGSPAAFHAAKFAFPDRGAWDVQAPALAAEVAARTGPEETIFIWGREPQIYVYAGRRAASRYIHDRPVWLQPDVLEEIRGDLAARRPALVLDTLDPAYFPEVTIPIEAVLPPGYREVGRLHFARVFARADAPLGESALR